ncbi:hypothetical protein B0T20DRAFT_477166 [Sordaria brevicollis]|uniref:RING-type domain-containing protein n=1 Tax=Sordaria brevicollis TaxID=83679 RepID=A0AAE0PJN9_SORBR|nr:hypothetical protein B0T20DRAFT_477166 [Sordaria brevicollis]
MMETPTSNSIKKAAASVNLESELTCSICTDLLYHPLTLLDCLHTFCGACLKEWFASQAYRAETSPLPPPPPSEQHKVFTCPACREPVRDTKHDARVATLLEMFLAMNPERTRPEEERREMDERYQKGGKVLPRIKRWEERSEEERRLDEEERRLLSEVQEMSLREAWAALEAGNGSTTGSMVGMVSSGSAVGGRTEERRRRASAAPHSSHQGRTSRDVSRNRAGTGSSLAAAGRDRERVRDSSAAPSTSSRIRAQSATLHPENHYAEERRRRRSESRQRETEARTKQLEHQSSLRSLISADDLGDIDIEREIEEFARQIQEEGLLDGLDLDNIDLDNNDELSKKIMEAYRRRHRERTRANAARRNTAAGTTQSPYRPEPLATSRTRPPPDHATRPASIRSGVSRSREPSASSNEERHRYPPSAGAAHLDVQGASRRRRTTSSASRSSTVPVPVQTEPSRVSAHRSQTEVIRSSTTDATQPIRPSAGVITESRSSSSPTVSSNPLLTTATTSSSDMRALSFNARAAGMGVTQPTSDVSSDSDTSGRRRRRTAANSDRRPSTQQSEIASPPSVPTFVSTSGPVSTHLAGTNNTPPAQPQSQPPPSMPRYPEPIINCNGCGMEHIEYKLHFNCSICHNGDWNICLDCWRKRKGCLHWFGFGYAVWPRWNKAKATHGNLPPPHRLTAVRYLPPPSQATTKQQSDNNNNSGRTTRLGTLSNPLDRLQSGTFCCRCSAFANECYWRCEFCNEGEWGFCNNCVNQEKACPHPLQALTYLPPSSGTSPASTPPADATSTSTPPTTDPSTTGGTHSRSSSISRPPSSLPGLPPFSKPNLSAPATGAYRPLTFSPPCELCSTPIPPSSLRYHCPVCPSQHSPQPRQGEYNICQPCYLSLVPDSLAEENGASGWRRCPASGHRMTVVSFIIDERTGLERRKVVNEIVGGHRLKIESFLLGGVRGMQIWSWREDSSASLPLPSPGSDVSHHSASSATGQKDGEEKEKDKWIQRLVSMDVAHPAVPPGHSPDEPLSPISPTSPTNPLSPTGAPNNRSPNGNGRFTTDTFPPDGGSGIKVTARFSWYRSSPEAKNELIFPKGAEISEVEGLNEEWGVGWYMGEVGLFPRGYVR